MPRTLIAYSGLAIASLVVIAVFITATTYMQLAAASLLYPLLIFFAYKVLPFKAKWSALKKPVMQRDVEARSQAKIQEDIKGSVGISDIDKRAFLKLIGATGISFLLISVFGRRFEALLFGQSTSPLTPPGNPLGGQINTATASPTDGYKISEIDNGAIGYYGFTNQSGGWLIMKEDSNSGSFRYAKGTSNFPFNWNNRVNLQYDYFHDLSF